MKEECKYEVNYNHKISFDDDANKGFHSTFNYISFEKH